MTNLITGLKYMPPYSKVETEKQIIEVFSELKNFYYNFRPRFRITHDRNTVEGCKQFLEIAVKEDQSVVLIGSGDIGGLVVEDASVEYDLSHVGKLAKHWDIQRDGSCLGCQNHYYDQSGPDSENACEVMDIHDRGIICPKYDSIKKNAEGKPARKLAELIEEVLLPPKYV